MDSINIVELANEKKHVFIAAARKLMEGVSTGTTSQGTKQLDVRISGEHFTFIEQNPRRQSRPAQLAREGHDIVQVRINGEAPRLIGFVNLDAEDFELYPNVVANQPMEMEEVEKMTAEGGQNLKERIEERTGTAPQSENTSGKTKTAKSSSKEYL